MPNAGVLAGESSTKLREECARAYMDIRVFAAQVEVNAYVSR